LEALNLGPTKLTQREIRMIMSFIDEDESSTIEYNEFAPLMFNWMVEALKIGFMPNDEDIAMISAYMFDHLMSYDSSGKGYLDYSTLKMALLQMDIFPLTPIQMHSVLAEAKDPERAIAIETFVDPAARLVQKLLDPMLEHKRATVSKMATVTPLQALTEDERMRLSQMAAGVFQTFDEDASGKLDRVEFHKCLTESKLGFTDRQINHMMAAADASEDGLIDFSEFADLFQNCILELARIDAIDKMLDPPADLTMQEELVKLLDEVMIPLHIAFDIAAEGGEALAPSKIIEVFTTKGSEWGIGQPAIDALCAEIGKAEGDMPWPMLIELIERMSVPVE